MRTFSRVLGILLLTLCVLNTSVGVRLARANEVTEELEAEVEEEVMHMVDYNQPPLHFNPVMFVFTLVLFGLFVLTMRSAAWKPLIAGLDAREERVLKAEQDAEAAKIEAKRLQKESEAKLAEVQNEVKAIVAAARAEAESEKLKIISQAEQDAERIKDEALAAIHSAREQALEELSRTVDDQVAAATEHIVGRRLG